MENGAVASQARCQPAEAALREEGAVADVQVCEGAQTRQAVHTGVRQVLASFHVQFAQA